MAKKVLYIKIARIDQNGNDLTNTLEALTQITIPLTSAGNKVYKILTRADFPTYYLFQVDLANSPDASTVPSTTETTLDYDFSGSISEFTTGSGNIIGRFNQLTGAGPQIATDFYNSSQQRLEINTMPKKDLFISIGAAGDAASPVQSFLATVVPGGTFADSASVELFKADSTFNNVSQLTNNEILTRGMGAASISRSVSIPKADITPGDVVFLGVKETGSVMMQDGARVSLNADSGGKFSGLFFLTSSAAAGPELENIVEPYLTKRFTNSDCDVLINNVDQYEENPFLQDIDFSSGTIVPVNYDQIVTGTAQKATVPESMFTMGGMINPNNSAINQVDRYNISGSSYFGQITGGTFACYYSSHTVGSVSINYQSTFILKYIITPDGEAIEITTDDDNEDFLERLFGSKANPAGLEANSLYGENDANVNVRAIPFSGSSAGGSMEYRGRSLVQQLGSNMVLKAISRGTIPEANPGPGIVYPASIELTSHADLPSKAREILTENNIIPPEN